MTYWGAVGESAIPGACLECGSSVPDWRHFRGCSQGEKEAVVTQNETLIERLERRGVITTDPDRAAECCGLPRDEDGFCTYREGHPIYVDPDGDR